MNRHRSEKPIIYSLMSYQSHTFWIASFLPIVANAHVSCWFILRYASMRTTFVPKERVNHVLFLVPENPRMISIILNFIFTLFVRSLIHSKQQHRVPGFYGQKCELNLGLCMRYQISVIGRLHSFAIRWARWPSFNVQTMSFQLV